MRLQEQSSGEESVAAGVAAEPAALLQVLRKQHVLLQISAAAVMKQK